MGLRVGGGLEVLLQQIEISQYQRRSRTGTEITIKCSRLVGLHRKDLLLDFMAYQAPGVSKIMIPHIVDSFYI